MENFSSTNTRYILTKSTAGKHSNRRPLLSKQTELTDAGPNSRLHLYVVAVDI